RARGGQAGDDIACHLRHLLSPVGDLDPSRPRLAIAACIDVIPNHLPAGSGEMARKRSAHDPESDDADPLVHGASVLSVVPHRPCRPAANETGYTVARRRHKVGFSLVHSSPLSSWTQGSWSTSACRHGPSLAPEHDLQSSCVGSLRQRWSEGRYGSPGWFVDG